MGHYFYTDYNIMIADYKNNVRSNSVNPQKLIIITFNTYQWEARPIIIGAELTNYFK